MFVCASTDLKIFNCDSNNIPVEDESASYILADQPPIRSVSWAKNNKYVAILPDGGLPEILSTNVYNVKRVQRIKAFSDASAICFKRCTKKHLCVGTRCGNLVEYDTINKSCKLGYGKLMCDVVALDYNCNDSCLAAATIDGLVTLYNTVSESAPVVYTLPNASRASSMVFSSDDEKILSAGSENGEVLLWDIATEQRLVCTQAHLSKVNGTALIKSDLIVTVGEDCKMCFYSLNTNTTVFRYNGIESLTAVTVSSDDRTLAVSSKRGNVYFYDLRYYLQPTNVVQVCEMQIYKISYSNKLLDDDGTASRLSKKTPKTLTAPPSPPPSPPSPRSLPSPPSIGGAEGDFVQRLRRDNEDDEGEAAVATNDISKVKEEIVDCFNAHLVALARELEENTASISNFVKEQIVNLETSFEVLFGTLMDMI